MIYLRKLSQLLLQEDWKMFITHLLIEIPLKKIFLCTKTMFIILDLAHLNQRFSSWHGSPLQLCQLGMVIVDHNGESSSSWDVWLWLTVCINGGNEMATKDPNTRITASHSTLSSQTLLTTPHKMPINRKKHYMVFLQIMESFQEPIDKYPINEERMKKSLIDLIRKLSSCQYY